MRITLEPIPSTVSLTKLLEENRMMRALSGDLSICRAITWGFFSG
ncbi:MAG: hypothetical protein ACD_75C01354G0003 [uncultured bacterium]|nr:MAG: hypothetical protein ACD_75C01354G0003 [uncultured bacterium]